jgi:sugar phosphate isomerase/epimerase
MNSKGDRDISKLCIHTITTKPWKIEEAAKNFVAAGVKGITVWRDALEGRNIRETGNMLRENDLTIVSLCRGGFFAHKDVHKRKAAIDDNKRAIEEATELGTSTIVLVCGADPSQSLEESRKQIRDGIALESARCRHSRSWLARRGQLQQGNAPADREDFGNGRHCYRIVCRPWNRPVAA